MTLLISDMSNTIIEVFKHGTFVAADFTLLLKKGVWADYFRRHCRIGNCAKRRQENHEKKSVKSEKHFGEDVEHGIIITAAGQATRPSEEDNIPDNEGHGKPARAGAGAATTELGQRLAVIIQRVAADLKQDGDGEEKRYSFEEWAEITRLIRFTSEANDDAAALSEEIEHLIEWDWLGEKSPMMAGESEPEFVLGRLCESLIRYIRALEARNGKEEEEDDDDDQGRRGQMST
jgi:potassium channel subfamily K